MSSWLGRLLIVVLLTYVSSIWDRVDGKAVRMKDSESLLTYGHIPSWLDSRLTFFREGRSPQHQIQEDKQYQSCANGLWQMVKSKCANARKGNHNNIPTSTGTRLGRSPREHQYPFSSLQNAARARDGVNIEGGPSQELDFVDKTPRKDLVDECCKNPCNETQLMKYCRYFKTNAGEGTTTTTTTTTTTPPPPLRSRHRLVRTRDDSSGPEAQSSSDLKRMEDEGKFRQKLIRDAVQCILNPIPTCVSIPERDGSGVKKSQKNKSTNTRKNKLYNNRTDRGKRLHRRRKLEKPIQVVQILLSWVIWGMTRKPKVAPLDPQPNPIVSQPHNPWNENPVDVPTPQPYQSGTYGVSNSFPSQSSHVTNNLGGGESYVPSSRNSEYYSNSYGQTQTKSPPTDNYREGLQVYTIPPSPHVFSLSRGTNDDILTSYER